MCSQKQIVRLFPYQSARFGLAMKYCVKICWKTTSNGQKQWESKYKRYGNVSMWNWAQDWIFGNVANERFSSTHLFNKIIWSEYKSNLANKWCVCVCVLTFLRCGSNEQRGRSANDWTNRKTENYRAYKICTHISPMKGVWWRGAKIGTNGTREMLKHIHTCQWKWSMARCGLRDGTFPLENFLYSVNKTMVNVFL